MLKFNTALILAKNKIKVKRRNIRDYYVYLSATEEAP